MCVLSTRTRELQKRRDAETRVSRREAGMRDCSRASVLPVPVENRREGGGKTRDRTVLIYKRRGMTLPIIKLAVLLSPRDRESCGESLAFARELWVH